MEFKGNPKEIHGIRRKSKKFKRNQPKISSGHDIIGKENWELQWEFPQSQPQTPKSDPSGELGGKKGIKAQLYLLDVNILIKPMLIAHC